MDMETLRSSVRAGVVDRTWLDEGGLGGYVKLGPLVSPFFVRVPEGEIPQAVAELRASRVFVDATWEVERIRELVAGAFTRSQYYGIPGGDVETYALRLAAVEPESGEARSLLLKVGERMAWDAEAAVEDGVPDMARELVSECLDLVPEHPRCTTVAQGLEGV